MPDFLVHLFFLLSLSLVILFPGYAEIHFRYRGLFSRLFQKEPEIIFDLPFRTEFGKPVPLFLLVKDAHLFPVQLQQASIQIIDEPGKWQFRKEITFEITIDAPFFARTLWLKPELLPHPGAYRIVAHLHYRRSDGKRRYIQQDNYASLPHPPFELYASPTPLPRLPDWHWGDLHVHSNYTADQVEFGAPIRETVEAARALGLDFLAFTDHSYDLDDQPDNFLLPDPQLRKWQAFREEVAQIQEEFPDFVLLPGEEVSVGNSLGQNVHCLVLNDPVFHPGEGDGAERLLRNRPTLTLPALLQRISGGALALAAHPKETPPFSQRLILRRGIWREDDLRQDGLTALQILNGRANRAFRHGRQHWITLLLQGKRIGLAAGSDAHGNFNCFRQIRIPFLSFLFHRHHLLGEVRTAVYSPDFSRAAVLTALAANRSLISNGPLATLEIVTDTARFPPGSVVSLPPAARLRIQAESTEEFGKWERLQLYLGRKKLSKEEMVPIKIPSGVLSFRTVIERKLDGYDYVRLEAFTRTSHQDNFCLTNPIWFVTNPRGKN